MVRGDKNVRGLWDGRIEGHVKGAKQGWVFDFFLQYWTEGGRIIRGTKTKPTS